LIWRSTTVLTMELAHWVSLSLVVASDMPRDLRFPVSTLTVCLILFCPSAGSGNRSGKHGKAKEKAEIRETDPV
jgi:hypothetical protein